MLSAIAARKAAAAAARPPPEKKVTPPKNDAPQQSPPLPESESDDLQPPSPPQKRKAEESESPKRKRQKKRTKFKNVDFGRPRYFEAPQALEGFDDERTFSPEVNEDFGPIHSSRAYSPSRPLLDVGLPEDQNVTSRFTSETPRPRGRYSPSRPIVDSSEDEDTPEIPAEPSEKEIIPSAESPHTTFTPRLNSNVFQLTVADLDILRIPSDAARTNDAALVLLTSGQSLSFVGSTCIILVQGSISILGTPITPSLHAHRVFSPRSSPIVSLEALDVPPPTGESSDHFRRNGVTLPARVQNVVDVSDSVVVIQTMQTGVEGLGKIFGTFDGVFEVDQEPSEAKDSFGVEGFHFINPHASPNSQLQYFFLPESWSKALDAVALPFTSGECSNSALSTSFVALVRGPKKCGKSTFARTLLNRLTTRYKHVAFLECDLGQSEFTPGGMVSLHVVSNPVFGPPFTHPRLPYRAHYVGHTTPHSSPSQYLSSIQALFQLYRLDIQYAYQETLTTGDPSSKENQNDNRIEGLVPLVVNTQGWIKGLGGDLLRKIEEIVGATQVFDLDMHTSMVPRQRMQLSSASVHALQPIPSSPLAKYYNSADHRSLAILSYFYCVFPSQHIAPEDVRWVTDLPLCARQPWAVGCTEAIDQIVLMGAGYEDVVSHELEYAINCGVVGLVCDEDPSTPTLDDSDPSISRFPYMQGAPPPDPTTSHCVGLGLVRGVDSATRTLHMLTPLPTWELSRCRVLIKGELELPVWGMLDFREGQDGVAGVPWGKVPYLQMSGAGGVVGAGAGRKRVRRNLMRRSQM